MATRKTNVEKEPDMKGYKITVNSRMLQSGVIMTTTMIAPGVTEKELELFQNHLVNIGDFGICVKDTLEDLKN